MQDPVETLTVYLLLARASDLRRQPLVTDRLIILAGALAVELSMNEIADRCLAAVLAGIRNISYAIGPVSLRHTLPSDSIDSSINCDANIRPKRQNTC